MSARQSWYRRLMLPGRARAVADFTLARLAWVRDAVRPGWRMLTPAGRAAAGIAAGSWLLGLWLGWVELFLVTASCVIALAIAAGFVLGRATLDITIGLEPVRLQAGGEAKGRLLAVNRSRSRLRSLSVELPVGSGRRTFLLPALAAGAGCEKEFSVATARRAVIPVGPPRVVRTDPLGLLRRDAAEQRIVELFAHPRVVPLDALSAGLQRDLEGQATRDLSTSDLAFHALRDYAAGDDRRHIHWRSSAKARKLLVRQFQDTRRSRLTIVVDGAAASYRHADEFELAMSVAGSVGAQAADDHQDICVVAAGHATVSSHRWRVLDTLARGELADQGQDLVTLAGRASRLATDTNVLMMITGSVLPLSALRAAGVFFGPDVKLIAIRAEPDAPPGVGTSGAMTILAVRTLENLPAVLARAVGA